MNHNLLAGTIYRVACGTVTVHADLDFETYSEAGFVLRDGVFKGISKTKRGLAAVGSAVYAQHPSTEVICLAYDLKDSLGPRLWFEGDPPPLDLFAHIQDGLLLEAHNALFEYFIWTYVCVPKYGWPPLPQHLLRCSMSKAAAHALPASLEKLALALRADVQKDMEGKKVMLKLSQPRKPTKADPALRYTRAKYWPDYVRTGDYCIVDIQTESAVSLRLPDLSQDELALWLLDQEINARGVHIDSKAVEDCISVYEQAYDKYTQELREICGGSYDAKGVWVWRVNSPSELQNLQEFLALQGVHTPSLDAEQVGLLLQRNDLPDNAKRALQIRDMLSASSVKKLYSLRHHLCSDSRVRGLFAFCGADRTGRFAGRGPQPQNMPSGGPKLKQCDPINGCGHLYQKKLANCPWCNTPAAFSKDGDWGPEGVEQALRVIASRNLHYVEHYYGDPVAVISGCLRGLFTAAPGKEFLCSDFSAIEAVVLAELAGEEWRQQVFRTHGKIYEMGAAMITGTPFEEFMTMAGYPDITKEGWWVDEPQPGGKNHPLRKTIGKVSELACFGADTLVLTQRGYVPIVEVKIEDKLWDGIEWVSHRGVVAKGLREVILLDGVQVTEEHPFVASYTGRWITAKELDFNSDALDLALSSTVTPNDLPKVDFVSATFRGKVEVYDITFSGPRSRFTIKTASGHLIAHNSGYAGWIGAWKNFGADKFMTDEEIKKAILAWRDASPMIVELWGGQYRKHPKKWEFKPEMYGLEGAAVQAIMNPGTAYSYRMITYQVHEDVLYCRLPSGRLLSYHQPRLLQSTAKHGDPVWQITYMGQDTVGRWVRLDTYGGKLTENVTQAVARDLLAFALLNLKKAGYDIVLHIHDEIVVEVDTGQGCINEVERIMAMMPDWAAGWPVKAAGGWRGKRYRKG